MLSKLKEINPIILFVLRFLALLLVWEVLYTFVIEPDGRLDAWLTSKVASVSVYLMNLFGLNVVSKEILFGCQALLFHGSKLLKIAHPCNGLLLFVLYSSFLISFKGDWLVKIIMLVIGFVGIFGINILRVIALVYIQIHMPKYLDFSHKWLFTIVVYSFVFFLWMLWVNKFSKLTWVKK